MVEHTPTPWIFGPYGCIWPASYVTFADGKWQELVDYPRIVASFDSKDKADAEFIVRAANSYDALIEENRRLREVLKFYANSEIYKPHPHGPAFEKRDLSSIARSALNVAEMPNSAGSQIRTAQRCGMETEAATGQPPVASVSTPYCRNDRWLPIAEADKSIATVQNFPDVSVTLRNSYPVWVRDEDGRFYEAVWSEGYANYWWDLEGESPVDPVEFMPHPLDPRYLVTDGSDPEKSIEQVKSDAP